jgi:hypothetical protein
LRYIRAHYGIALVIAAVDQDRLPIDDLSGYADFANYVANTVKKLHAAPAPVRGAGGPGAGAARREEIRSNTDKEKKFNAKWTQLDILVAAVGTPFLCAKDRSFERISNAVSLRYDVDEHANQIKNAITSLGHFKGRTILLVDCFDLTFERSLREHTGQHPDILSAIASQQFRELVEPKLTRVAEWISTTAGKMAVVFVCATARQRGEALRHLLYNALKKLRATTTTYGLVQPHDDQFSIAVCRHSSECSKCHTKTGRDADNEEEIVDWIARGLDAIAWM